MAEIVEADPAEACLLQQLVEYSAPNIVRIEHASRLIGEHPEPYVMTETKDKIIQAILNLLNANGLTAQQAKALLGRLNQLINVGELLARKTAY